MRPQVFAGIAWGSLASTSLALLLYCLLLQHTFRDTWFYEGWIFVAHIALAAIGLVMAIIAIRRHPAICVVSAVVAGYLVLVQLVL